MKLVILYLLVTKVIQIIAYKTSKIKANANKRMNIIFHVVSCKELQSLGLKLYFHDISMALSLSSSFISIIIYVQLVGRH